MKKFLNWFSAGFAAFFSIPTFLILISWNAIPGDGLYGLKTALEDVALAITIRTPLASTLSVSYTERRFSEANILLSKKGSTVGYSLLVNEANESKDIIVGKKDAKQAAQLVTKIEEYQRDIEEKQELIRQGSLSVPVKTPKKPGASTPVPTYQPTTPTPTYTPVTPAPTFQPTTPEPTPPTEIEAEEDEEEVIEDLEKVKDDLEEVKDEIKRNLPQQASENAQEAVNKDKKKEVEIEDDMEDGGRNNRHDD